MDQAAKALNAKEYNEQLTILPLDLMKLSSVRYFAEQVCIFLSYLKILRVSCVNLSWKGRFFDAENVDYVGVRHLGECIYSLLTMK